MLCLLLHSVFSQHIIAPIILYGLNWGCRDVKFSEKISKINFTVRLFSGDLGLPERMQVLYFQFRYDTYIPASDTSLIWRPIWIQYESNISALYMMHTFVTYFVIWSVRKAAGSDITLTERKMVSNQQSYGICSLTSTMLKCQPQSPLLEQIELLSIIAFTLDVFQMKQFYLSFTWTLLRSKANLHHLFLFSSKVF